MSILRAEGFLREECEDCGESIGTEENLMDICSEPFNGVIIECPNEDCDAEYSLDLGIKIEKI